MSEMKTFVFTDIVQSVTLKGQMTGRSDSERDEAYVSTILTPHRQQIETGLEECGGRVVSTAGDGHFLVFTNTIDAAIWAIRVQESHRDHAISTPTGEQVQVRMSLHVGFPQPDPGDPDNFIGRVVDYAARLNDYATGSQVLISSAALGLLKDAGLEGVQFHPHGEHELRGIGSVEVYELLYDDLPARPTRNEPKNEDRRSWDVLPATMGLTEYVLQGSSGGVTQVSAKKPTVPQERLGNYELEELLGAGGMGNVYKARHVQFDRVRAIKVIKPHFLESGGQSIIKRFYREIKAVGALDHPNVVVAVDSSAPGDQTHYLVMEYVEGVSTDDLVKRAGPLSVANACEIIRQAAEGLEYINTQGMVHRDIKPSNLMLTLAKAGRTMGGGSNAEDDGQPLVKILDLGLALLVDEDQPRLTQMDHGAMGTAMYMSPEQWKTTSVDIRSDIYSLGCTLFHLLRGSPPFFDSDLKPEKAHERLTPPSLRPRGDVPKALDAVVKQMMAKRPQDRFQTPGEVAAALAPLAADADLPLLVTAHGRGDSDAATKPNAGAETQPGSTRQRDTLAGRRQFDHPDWGSQGSQLPAWRRWAVPAALAISLIAVAGLAWAILGLRQEKMADRKKALIDLAAIAEPQLDRDIKDRVSALSRAASSSELREAMVSLADAPDDWDILQNWIIRERAQHEEDLPCSSWFLTNAEGLQVARAPKSESVGDTYWRRDYFHGQGLDLPKDHPERPQPIRGEHLSAIYRSTSSGKLKTAFSVPVWSTEKRVKDRRVVGVLAMSIELGHFRLTEVSRRLKPPTELVLIDLRQEKVDGDTSKGLLLHHPYLNQVKRPVWLPEPALREVFATINGERTGYDARLIENYTGPLDQAKRPFWGGFHHVNIPSQSQEDAKWLVLIQEPMP